MSAAILAKTAQARASIAIGMMRAGRTSSRSFSDCFEMGDGDTVVRLILVKAKTDSVLMGLCRKVLASDSISRLGGNL